MAKDGADIMKIDIALAVRTKDISMIIKQWQKPLPALNAKALAYMMVKAVIVAMAWAKWWCKSVILAQVSVEF